MSRAGENVLPSKENSSIQDGIHQSVASGCNEFGVDPTVSVFHESNPLPHELRKCMIDGDENKGNQNQENQPKKKISNNPSKKIISANISKLIMDDPATTYATQLISSIIKEDPSRKIRPKSQVAGICKALQIAIKGFHEFKSSGTILRDIYNADIPMFQKPASSEKSDTDTPTATIETIDITSSDDDNSSILSVEMPKLTILSPEPPIIVLPDKENMVEENVEKESQSVECQIVENNIENDGVVEEAIANDEKVISNDDAIMDTVDFVQNKNMESEKDTNKEDDKIEVEKEEENNSECKIVDVTNHGNNYDDAQDINQDGDVDVEEIINPQENNDCFERRYIHLNHFNIPGGSSNNLISYLIDKSVNGTYIEANVAMRYLKQITNIPETSLTIIQTITSCTNCHNHQNNAKSTDYASSMESESCPEPETNYSDYYRQKYKYPNYTFGDTNNTNMNYPSSMGTDNPYTSSSEYTRDYTSSMPTGNFNYPQYTNSAYERNYTSSTGTDHEKSQNSSNWKADYEKLVKDSADILRSMGMTPRNENTNVNKDEVSQADDVGMEPESIGQETYVSEDEDEGRNVDAWEAGGSGWRSWDTPEEQSEHGHRNEWETATPEESNNWRMEGEGKNHETEEADGNTNTWWRNREKSTYDSGVAGGIPSYNNWRTETAPSNNWRMDEVQVISDEEEEAAGGNDNNWRMENSPPDNWRMEEEGDTRHAEGRRNNTGQNVCGVSASVSNSNKQETQYEEAVDVRDELEDKKAAEEEGKNPNNSGNNVEKRSKQPPKQKKTAKKTPPGHETSVALEFPETTYITLGLQPYGHALCYVLSGEFRIPIYDYNDILKVNDVINNYLKRTARIINRRQI